MLRHSSYITAGCWPPGQVPWTKNLYNISQLQQFELLYVSEVQGGGKHFDDLTEKEESQWMIALVAKVSAPGNLLIDLDWGNVNGKFNPALFWAWTAFRNEKRMKALSKKPFQLLLRLTGKTYFAINAIDQWKKKCTTLNEYLYWRCTTYKVKGGKKFWGKQIWMALCNHLLSTNFIFFLCTARIFRCLKALTLFPQPSWSDVWWRRLQEVL